MTTFLLVTDSAIVRAFCRPAHIAVPPVGRILGRQALAAARPPAVICVRGRAIVAALSKSTSAISSSSRRRPICVATAWRTRSARLKAAASDVFCVLSTDELPIDPLISTTVMKTVVIVVSAAVSETDRAI